MFIYYIPEREERLKMRLVLQRKWATGKSTIGELYVDGVFECYTLEDVVRSGPKVPGATAIPAGKYKIIIDMSTRFKRLMPHVLNVPGFEGVRIHSGNTDADTEGCPLLGRTKEQDFVGESKLAFDTFFPKLQAAKEAELQVLDVPVESDLKGPSIESQTSYNNFLESIIALIASLLGNILPQPKQP